MGTQTEAQELANTIYEQHQTIIDFVLENRDSNKKYQQYWEKEHPKVDEFAKKIKELIEKADPENKYELGYVQNNITIKRKINTQRYYIIYYVYNGTKPNSNLEFSFPAGEVKDKTKKIVREIVGNNNKVNNNKKVTYGDKTYFKIFSANLLSDDELIEMHTKRFEPNQQQ